jgi:hypothetical protein
MGVSGYHTRTQTLCIVRTNTVDMYVIENVAVAATV